LFTPEEVRSIFEKDKKVKRLFFMQRLPVKARGDEDAGKTYIGQWRNINNQMAMDGFGELTFSDGSIYTGQLQNNVMAGRGRILKPNGDIYHGEWVGNRAQGNGIFASSDGNYLDGQWTQDEQNGFGKNSWNNGEIKYEGHF